MSEVIYSPSKNPKTLLFPLLCSVLVIFFLFYIDEGYYNMNWMQHPGNWIAFGLYLLVFSIGQFITHQFILARYKGDHKITLTSLVGIPLGFGMILIAFYFAIL